MTRLGRLARTAGAASARHTGPPGCPALMHRCISASSVAAQDAGGAGAGAPAGEALPSPPQPLPSGGAANGGAGALTAADSRRPAPADVEEFLLALQRADLPVNSFRVARGAQAAAALSREIDSVATLPRQIAHMLLTQAIVDVDDLANPAKYWNDGYDEEKGVVAMTASEWMESGSSAAPPMASDVSRAAVAQQADDAFGVREGGKPVVGPSSSPAPRASGPVPVDWARVDTARLGPCVGGALSLVPAGGTAPVTVTGGAHHPSFTPNPVGTLYLLALAQQLEAIAARVTSSGAGVAAAAASMGAAGVEAGAAHGVAVALLSPLGLSTEQAKWVAGLGSRAGQTEAFAVYAAALRGSGGGAEAGRERSALLTAAARVLRDAAAGWLGPAAPGLPTIGAVHAALASTVGRGVSTGGFTLQSSAAAATGAQCLSRAQGVVLQLNAATAWAASTVAKYGAAHKVGSTRPSDGRSFVSLTASLPSVADLVLAGLGGAGMPGEVTHLPVTVKGVAAGGRDIPITFQLAPAGLHAMRLACGHVPSMLAPLTPVLTPSEWEAVLALLSAARPGGADAGSLFLPYPVGGSGGGGATRPSGSSEVTAARASFDSPSTHPAALRAQGTTVSREAGTDALLAMPVSTPTSTLNAVTSALGGEAALGVSSHSESAAVAGAVASAPSEASAKGYLSFLVARRNAGALLAMSRSMDEAALEAASTAVASAGADPASLAALRTLLGLQREASLTGELTTSDEEAVRSLREAEAGLPLDVKRRMTQSPSEELERTLRAARGYAPLGQVALQAKVRAGMGGAAPGAVAGPAATSAAVALPDDAYTARVDYTRASAALAGSPPPTTGAPAFPLDGSLARVGSTVPGLVAHLRGVATVGATPAGTPAAGLTEEDCGGVLNRDEAVGAYFAGGGDLLPLLPRAHPADMATVAQLEEWARKAAGGDGDAGKQLATWAEGAGAGGGGSPLLLRKQSQGCTELGQRLAVMLAQVGAPGGGGDASGAGSGVGGALPSLDTGGTSARSSVVRVPKLSGMNEGAVGEEGLLAALRAPDTDRAVQVATAEAAHAATAYADMAQVTALDAMLTAVEGGSRAYGADREARLGGGPWWAGSYEAPHWYRAPQQYTPAHKRMLEAVQAKDLGAVWALWSEHCRLADPCGDPDILALEIVMDACADARRTDLLFHALWPRAMTWRVTPTPAMAFALLKGAAMDGDGPLATSFFLLHKDMEAPVDGRHYTALLSAHTAHSLRTDVPPREAVEERKAAYSAFNAMLRGGHPASAQVFSTLFAAVREDVRRTEEAASAGGASGGGAGEDAVQHEAKLAELRQQAHYLWRCLSGSPGLRVSPALYTLVVTTLADAGGPCLQDMEAALERQASRKVDGRLPATPRALEAAFTAHAAAGNGQDAARHFSSMEALGYLDSTGPGGGAPRAGGSATGAPLLPRGKLIEILEALGQRVPASAPRMGERVMQ